MGERIQILEKDLTLENPLGKTKEMLWANIIDSVNYIWLSIQVIFEQTKLVKIAIEAIQKVKEELGNKPEHSNRLIHFLNRKNRYELNELKIEDRTATILEIRKVLSKRNLMLNLEEKCHSVQVATDRFMAKFQILREKGLPSPMVINDKLIPQLDYGDRQRKLAKEQASSSAIKALPTGKVLYDTLENLFFLEHEVKHLFLTKTNFAKYTEADGIYKRMMNVQLPDAEWWEKMTDLL